MALVRRAAVVALLMTAAATAAPAQSAPPKFAYVDSRAILSQAPGRAEAEAQFEREMSTFRQQVKRMGDSLNAMIADYDKQVITLSPTAKETRQKAIREKETQYNQRTAQLQEQAQQRQDELVRPITAQIQKILEDIRAEEGYTMIFDVGSGVATIVAADKNLDITNRVIAKLQQVASTSGAAGGVGAGTTGATAPSKPAAGPTTPTPAGVTRPKTPPTR